MMRTRASSLPTVKMSWILVAQRTLWQFTQVRNTVETHRHKQSNQITILLSHYIS